MLRVSNDTIDATRPAHALYERDVKLFLYAKWKIRKNLLCASEGEIGEKADERSD